MLIGDKDYRTIVADPPWPGPVSDWRAKPLVVREHSLNKHGRVAPANLFDLMSLEAIKEHQPRTSGQAHLYLWCLPQHVDWAYDTVRAWGFNPVILMAWCKPGLGSGRFQGNTEYFLVARKGLKNNPFSMSGGTHFDWPRLDPARKPQEMFDLVRRMSPGPYLEMYARGHREGWDVWGKEADSRVPSTAG